VWIEQYLLKGRYFPKRSNERMQVRMIMLLIYLPALAIIFDLIESSHYGDTEMMGFEIGALGMLALVMILFPRWINVFHGSIIILFVYTVFLFMALYVPDHNAELTLFWFAALPIGTFYFLGLKRGLYYTVFVVLLFLMVLVLGYVGIAQPIYDTGLIWQLLFGFLAVSYILYVIESERNVSEQNLKSSLENNKILFKEMHHRTKNNMQVMMGLLETQSFKIEDPKCQKMLHAHIDRIKAMAYVHENLYTGISIDEVDMHKYLGEILDNLQKITQHTLITDIDYVTMDIKNSMSIGLIVNEAVSNAIEHAYSIGSNRIDVSLKRYGNRCELSIKDYGLGFNKEREFNSLGMTLIEDLSASLPGGTMHLDTAGGTHIQIYFNCEGGKRDAAS
jgi:two-component sensor histidine kinase